jgi:hypothetical protein
MAKGSEQGYGSACRVPDKHRLSVTECFKQCGNKICLALGTVDILAGGNGNRPSGTAECRTVERDNREPFCQILEHQPPAPHEKKTAMQE